MESSDPESGSYSSTTLGTSFVDDGYLAKFEMEPRRKRRQKRRKKVLSRKFWAALRASVLVIPVIIFLVFLFDMISGTDFVSSTPSPLIYAVPNHPLNRNLDPDIAVVWASTHVLHTSSPSDYDNYVEFCDSLSSRLPVAAQTALFDDLRYAVHRADIRPHPGKTPIRACARKVDRTRNETIATRCSPCMRAASLVDSSPLTVAMFSDNQFNFVSFKSILSGMAARNPADLIIGAGDFVQNGNSFLEWQIMWFAPWNRFMKKITLPRYGTIEDEVPVVPLLAMVHGNHDGDFFLSRSVIPSPGKSPFYTLSVEKAVFILLDSVRITEKQTQWLSEQLEDAASDAVEFVIPIMHHPPFSRTLKRLTLESLDVYGQSKEVRDTWVPLFKQHNDIVRLVVSGHSHCYEFGQCGPEYNGTDPPITYAVIGGAGLPDYNWFWSGCGCGGKAQNSLDGFLNANAMSFYVELKIQQNGPRHVMDWRVLRPRGGTFDFETLT